jgi:hypothetical protein
MRIEDHQGQLALICDACQGTITSAHVGATIGLHGPQIVAVHRHCRDYFSQFFLNEAGREITPAAFVAELQAAVGV